MVAGRKRKSYDPIRFAQLYSKWINGEIEQKDIYTELGISRATFARRLAEFQERAKSTSIGDSIFFDPTLQEPDSVNICNGIDLLNNIKDGTIATVFFDPEYRQILDYLSYGNEGIRQTNRVSLPQMDDNTIRKFIHGIDRVLKPSGYLMLWVDKFIVGEGCESWFFGTDLQRVDLLVWDKGRIGMGPRTRRQSEFLLIYQKPPIAAKTTWIDHAIPDIWREKVTKKHAHNKPVQLQKKLILATTSPGDVILDPSAGSYSVMQAVSDLGDRHFLGCDLIDPTNEKAG